MEFVIVEFSEDRGVLIDDQPSGSTNQTLTVEEGHHEFALAGDANFEPPTQQVLVQNTVPDDPQKVVFSIKPDHSGDGGSAPGGNDHG